MHLKIFRNGICKADGKSAVISKRFLFHGFSCLIVAYSRQGL